VLESPAWQETPLVVALPTEQWVQLREDMGELLLLLAGAMARQGQVDLSLRLNALAADCFPTATAPRALWRQRAELARSAGHDEEARHLEDRAEKAPMPAAHDRYLYLLTEYRNRCSLPKVVPFLQEASRRQNDNFSVWMMMGHCYSELGRPGEAVECYDMARALWPEALWPYMFRGMACLDRRDYRRALADFDEVIRLRPEMRRAYFDRALAKYHLGDLPGAQADLTHLLSDPKPPLRAYFLRAKVRERRGDREGARRDREDGLRGEPRDEQDWTARGLARLPRDPKAALADYEAALKLNPRYLTALQNKANVLAENLGRTQEAIAVLDRILALRADDVHATASRGVLHARLGHREAAHADAREALRRDSKPFNTYQVAGIYALTSRQEPDDRREAFRLLGSALDRGCGLDLLDRDPDLDAIRDQAEFCRMVEAARARRASGNPRAAKP
jgi:tetratricopeptide (TPR) repeat protein